MKYVIKDVATSDIRYLQAPDYLRYRTSEFVYDLDDATKFDSIQGALETIRVRDNIYTPGFSPDLRGVFTIVGVKEVRTPRYEEVAL